MKTPLPIPVLVAVLLGFVAFNSAFIIDQAEQGSSCSSASRSAA
jgi:hypothetical protein